MLVKMTRLGAMPTRVGTLTRDERRAEAAYLFYRSIGQLSNSLRGTEVWDAESARLPEHIFNHFAKCADVPGPKRKEFLLEISIPVRAWAQGLMTHGNYFRQYHSIRRHVSALLKQLRPTVETLRQESIVLPSATVKLEIACDFVLIKRSLGCDRSFLVDLYQQLDVLGEAVEDAIESLGVAGQVRPKGPLSSIKGYPRFNILVFGLERTANSPRIGKMAQKVPSSLVLMNSEAVYSVPNGRPAWPNFFRVPKIIQPQNTSIFLRRLERVASPRPKYPENLDPKFSGSRRLRTPPDGERRAASLKKATWKDSHTINRRMIAWLHAARSR
jgi:hypothetical protein